MTAPVSFLSKQHTDALRGVAILIIIICHVTAQVLPFEVARLFTPLGGIGVSVFLFLSGYGLSAAYGNSLKNYWKKRLSGAGILYLAVWVMTIWLKQFSTAGEAFLDLFAIKPQITFYWYIGYLFLWYAIFYVITAIRMPDRIKNIVLTVICFTLFIACDELLAEQSFSFFLGMLTYKYYKKAKAVMTGNFALLILLLAGASALALKQLPLVRNSELFVLVQVLIKVPLSIFITAFVYKFWSKVAAFIANKLGRISYELFLAHSVTILLFERLTYGLLAELILFVAATAALTAALYYINRVLRLLVSAAGGTSL